MPQDKDRRHLTRMHVAFGDSVKTWRDAENKLRVQDWRELSFPDSLNKLLELPLDAWLMPHPFFPLDSLPCPCRLFPGLGPRAPSSKHEGPAKKDGKI